MNAVTTSSVLVNHIQKAPLDTMKLLSKLLQSRSPSRAMNFQAS
jgi:hypothetical protein